MKRILINIALALLFLVGLAWSSSHSGLIALSGFLPMYVGGLGLIKYNTKILE